MKVEEIDAILAVELGISVEDVADENARLAAEADALYQQELVDNGIVFAEMPSSMTIVTTNSGVLLYRGGTLRDKKEVMH